MQNPKEKKALLSCSEHELEANKINNEHNFEFD